MKRIHHSPSSPTTVYLGASAVLLLGLLVWRPALAAPPTGYVTVSGRVLEPRGQAAAGVTVVTLPKAAIACTGRDGRFSMRVPAGTTYLIGAARTGWRVAWTQVSGTLRAQSRPVGASLVLTARDARVRQPSCRARGGLFDDRARVVYGRVTDVRGEAAAGVRVKVDGQRPVAITDALGAYTIVLPPGAPTRGTFTVRFSGALIHPASTRIAVKARAGGMRADNTVRRRRPPRTTTSTTRRPVRRPAPPATHRPTRR